MMLGTTIGTPLEMMSATGVPCGSELPDGGLNAMTSPAGTGVLNLPGGDVVETWNPLAPSAAPAACGVSPVVTGGTTSFTGVPTTSMVIDVPSSSWLPATIDCVVTVPTFAFKVYGMVFTVALRCACFKAAFAALRV